MRNVHLYVVWPPGGRVAFDVRSSTAQRCPLVDSSVTVEPRYTLTLDEAPRAIPAHTSLTARFITQLLYLRKRARGLLLRAAQYDTQYD